MTVTYTEAIDDIDAIFWNQWKTLSAGVVGYVPNVQWHNVEQQAKIDGSKFWCRVSTQNVNEEQASLSTCVGAPIQKRYTAYGLVFIQLFCPKSNSKSAELGRELAQIARNAFRGRSTPGRVWFRNARINELVEEDLFYRYNVVAEYEYDDLG